MVSKELIGEAYRLAEKYRQLIYATAIGSQVHRLKSQLDGYPLEKVFLYESEEAFQAHIYEEPMVGCIAEVKPAIVLIGGTHEEDSSCTKNRSCF